jgi:hypothetical protein
MTIDRTTAQEDLAFLRRLIPAEVDAETQRRFGRIYAVWGGAFAAPLFVQWLAMIGLIGLPDWYWTAASVAITLVLVVFTILVGRRDGPALGVQARAWRSVFAGVGWANVAVLVALVLVANSLKDGRVMMIHGVVVFAFQGAAWYLVWALRKVVWTGVVAGGWYLFAVGLGATLPGPSFVLLAAMGLFLLMVVPGVIMMRTPDRAD